MLVRQGHWFVWVFGMLKGNVLVQHVWSCGTNKMLSAAVALSGCAVLLLNFFPVTPDNRNCYTPILWCKGFELLAVRAWRYYVKHVMLSNCWSMFMLFSLCFQEDDKLLMVTVFFTLYYKYLDAIEDAPVPVWYNIKLPLYSSETTGPGALSCQIKLFNPIKQSIWKTKRRKAYRTFR